MRYQNAQSTIIQKIALKTKMKNKLRLLDQPPANFHCAAVVARPELFINISITHDSQQLISRNYRRIKLGGLPTSAQVAGELQNNRLLTPKVAHVDNSARI